MAAMIATLRGYADIDSLIVRDIVDQGMEYLALILDLSAADAKTLQDLFTRLDEYHGDTKHPCELSAIGSFVF